MSLRAVAFFTFGWLAHAALNRFGDQSWSFLFEDPYRPRDE